MLLRDGDPAANHRALLIEEIEDLDGNLRLHLQEVCRKACGNAMTRSATETGLRRTRFPADPP